MWNCTHFRHPTDEQLRHVDIYFLATKMICSLSTLNTCVSKQDDRNKSSVFCLASRVGRPLHISNVRGIASIYAHMPVRTCTADMWKKYIFIFLKSKFYHYIRMADRFFGQYWCLCVSISLLVSRGRHK